MILKKKAILKTKAILRSKTFAENKMVTKHLSGTKGNTVESFYFPDREGIKCQNLKHRLRLKWKNSQIDHLAFKIRIFIHF